MSAASAKHSHGATSLTLPGEGQPLELEDDRLLPEEVRVAYRVLKNAGLVPPEVESLQSAEPARTGNAAIHRLETILERHGRPRGTLSRHPGYAARIMERLARR